MAEGETDLVQRVGHKFEDYGIEDLDDISYSSSASDSESDYGADREDNDDFPDERVVAKDPGPFRYNRKMIIVSLPCAFMVMTLVGEIFLMAASFGAGIILILDPKGEKKRCLILFTLLFVFCHMYTIYSIIPLLWLSFFNLFLIGVINVYVILTGGLIALQFTFFRKFEQKLAATVERMLFSVYPWCCVMLLTWTASSIIRWQLIPYVYMALGFVYLQMFMAPHTSSFREGKSDELDLNIIPEVISLTMAIIYCLSPSMLHMVLHFINGSLVHVFSATVLMHLVFIFSLSMFLSTLMSLRGVFDFTGWKYDYVILGRTISGTICTALLYPVLIQYQLSSHFLPWLPAGVAVFAIYGYLLSDKKYKVALLMVFGQKVVWNALQHGQKQFGGIIDLCSQLVADVAADFIIKQGGWGSVMNFDPSQSSDTLSSAELDTSNDLHDFFSSHNVTQVDSHSISLIEDSGKLTDHNNREKHGNVKQSVRLKLNGKESIIGYNGSHDADDSEKQDDDQIISDVDVGEILFVDKIQSDDASSNNTGLQYKQAGSFSGSLNKSRYASSIGFDIDESGENTDLNPDMEENTSLAYFQVPAYGDRSQVTDNEDKRVEDTDADFISASRDMSNGSPVFTFIGDFAQSDVASSKYDLNAGKGDTRGDYGKDSVYIKQATPSTSTFIYSAVQSEQSNSNKSGNSVKDESEFQREIRNVDETIEVQQRLSDNIDGIPNVLMQPCDHFRIVESVDTCNSNNNNTSNETHAVPPCIDITPSVVYSDNIDRDPHVDEENPLNISDISDSINATRDITSIDICENQREMIQDEASSNQREATCNNTEENVNRSGQFLHHISRRRVQVGVITMAAVAVAVCVKVISR